MSFIVTLLPKKDENNKINNQIEEIKSLKKLKKIHNSLYGDKESSDILDKVHSKIRTIRKNYKENNSSLLKELRIQSTKEYTFYEENLDLESDKTFIPKKIKLNKSINIDMTKLNSIDILKIIKDTKMEFRKMINKYREDARKIPFEEKSLKIENTNIKLNTSYKVFQGGVFNYESEEKEFKDIWRGNNENLIEVLPGITKYTLPIINNSFFIHQEGGTFLRLNKETKIRKVFQTKTPKENDNKHRVGIEIEFISKSNQLDLAKLFLKHNVQDYVNLGEDVSVKSEGQYKYNHELRVLIEESELEEVLKRVMIALEEGECRVNASCGLHVHLDSRFRDHKLLFQNLVKTQPILFNMNPSNRSESKYCKKVKVSNFDEVVKLMDRRLGINPMSYNEHKTIEIRLHSGSTNFNKINNWCKILTSIANYPRPIRNSISNPELFCTKFGLNNNMLEYIKERTAKFKDLDGNHITIEESI